LNNNALFFDPKRHHEALTLLAADYLQKGENAAAFQYADRRCRLLTPRAQDYLVRSEASRRAGFSEEADRDLDKALQDDPTNILVLKIALHRGTIAQKRFAASCLIGEGFLDRETLRQAVAVLIAQGERLLFDLRLQEEQIAGWAVWSGSGVFRLRNADGELIELSPAPHHWLAGVDRHGCEIVLPAHERATRIEFLRDGRTIAARTFPSLRAKAQPSNLQQREVGLSVVVPVYEDFVATRACFEALYQQGPDFVARIIAVDDASPNTGLRLWLDQQADEGRIILLRNSFNLGFAASVNRALEFCASGDVLLLNADALPPPTSLARLAEVARSEPDIGTVTPLSNNGEYANFPASSEAGPLGTPEEVARIDRLARQANGAACVDMPNGIGFCLYITRACLDAIGPLPELYARGYYEDVEFCLRARERGFRNVCAVGVYVGHAGSRSFGAEKRRLVKRNLKILERRFPDYRLESGAFLKSDPLRASRGAIEALAPKRDETILLVCAAGASRLYARERAKELAAGNGPAPLICACGSGRAELRGAEGAWPQSLGFRLDDAEERRALSAYLKATKVVAVELFDPLSLPLPLLLSLFRLGAPVEIVGGDVAWAAGPGGDNEFRSRRIKLKRRILAHARAIRPLDHLAEAFARDMFGESLVAPLDEPEARPAAGPKPQGALALITPLPDPLADRVIVALGRALLGKDATARIVVLGVCVNDFVAMGPGNVFVAGAVETGEYERLLRQYEVSALMSPFRTGFFGFVDRLSRAFALKQAYFDYSFGKIPPADGDLALDPSLCDAKAAALAADWFLAR
jgi:GT2 family glycosyltransferase